MMTAKHLILLLLLPLCALSCGGTDHTEKPEHEQQSISNIKKPLETSTEEPKDDASNAVDRDQDRPTKTEKNKMTDAADKQADQAPQHEVATLGSGCFWCTEAVLEQLEGVVDVESGYTGGELDDPTYKDICSGSTGHAEVVKVTFDPAVISYESLLDWFFRSHDPTTLNRQGADVGTQYRSAIFFHSKEQQLTAIDFIKQVQNNWGSPIVTELTPAVKFWPAEAYHQDYFRNNQNQGYCQVVIKPKLAKLGMDDAPKK